MSGIQTHNVSGDRHWLHVQVIVYSTTMRSQPQNNDINNKYFSPYTASQWFSLGTPVSSTNKTDRHDITEILLKVALNSLQLFISFSLNNKPHLYCLQLPLSVLLVQTVISWRSVLLVEETGVPRENHWLAASHWQTLSHNVVSSTLRHERGFVTKSVWYLWRNR
jgi:hypothetical protein